jgi:AraC family transcriptional regulator
VKGHAPTAMVNTWKQIFSECFPSNGYEPAEVAAFEAYIDSDFLSPAILKYTTKVCEGMYLK